MIRILVGTMTGTAESVAKEVERVLCEDELAVSVQRMDGLFAEIFATGETFLICTSTYGKGNVPDNAFQLYSSLKQIRPDLSNVGFGLIGLGDSRYPKTFANGGKRFDEILTELGAHRIGTQLTLNASSGISVVEAATSWSADWIVAVRQDIKDQEERRV